MFLQNSHRVMSLNVLFKFAFLVGTCAVIRGDQCEVVFYYGDINDTTITCVRGDQFPPSLFPGSNVLNNDCEQQNSTDSGRLILQHVTAVENEGCVLRPNLLGFLHLPNVVYFTSNPDSGNSILPNNTFAGLCGLKNIILSGNGIRTVEPVAFRCLKYLARLDMSRNFIEVLSPGVFKGMPHLAELNLNINSIRQLPQDLFDDLPSLRFLDVGFNDFSEIPDQIFRQQISLQTLIMAGNLLRDLNEVVFSYLIELKHLDLIYTSLVYIGNIFSGNSKLEYLDISHNSELMLTNDTFKGLSALKYLDLEQCRMHLLPKGLFVDATSLTRIDMRYNNLKEIDANTFLGLQNVQELVLQNNRIVKIRGSPFIKFGKLELLNLDENRLSEIKFDNLQGLVSILTLTLASNAIKNIESRSFDHMANLEKLYLDSNLISTLHESSISQSILSNLTRLKYLDLRNNKLRRLTNVFIGNGDLNTLKISQNSELELDDMSFKGLFKVRDLYLDMCNIDHLPSGLFTDVQNLDELYLQNNNLKAIGSDAFGNLKGLTGLNLAFNNISILKNQPFAHNGNLRYLNMSNNNLSEIKSNDLVGLSLLSELDVSYNCIENIPDRNFHEISSLTDLNISHNSISFIENTLLVGDFVELYAIDISHNRLTDIRSFKWYGAYETWITNNKIRELYLPQYIENGRTVHLEWNDIRRLHIAPYEINRHETYSESKPRIFLRGNPLQCDCHAYELYLYVNENPRWSIEFEGGLHCQFHLKQRGRQLTDLNSTDFVCDVTELCSENCSCTYIAHGSIRMVNCSGKGYARLPGKIPPNTNVLFMDGNSLASLNRTDEIQWENLTSLHAENNLIEDSEFFVPNDLTFLGLRGNKLKRFPVAVQKHAEIVEEFKTELSDNPWPCDCSVVDFKLWLIHHARKVIDVAQVRCIFANGSVSRVALTRMEDVLLCPELDRTPSATTAYIIGFTVVFLSMSIFLLYFRYRLDIVPVLFTHYNGLYSMCSCDANADEGDKAFDCFISYVSADREVALAMLEELEYKPPHYRFCIHERNWVSGHFITDNIIGSVRNSRKTIIVLSETFLKSQWFQQEFQAAYYQTLQDRKDRLVFVLKGKMPDSSELDSDVHFVLSSKTYLLWGERWFWEKLRYAIHVQKDFVGLKKRRGFREWIGWLSRGPDHIRQDITHE